MTERLAPVILRAEVEVNGRPVMAQQAHSQEQWRHALEDPAYHGAIMGALRASLGEAIVRGLDPTVTVHMPTELDEAVMQRALEERERGCGIGRGSTPGARCTAYPECTCGT